MPDKRLASVAEQMTGRPEQGHRRTAQDTAPLVFQSDQSSSCETGNSQGQSGLSVVDSRGARVGRDVPVGDGGHLGPVPVPHAGVTQHQHQRQVRLWCRETDRQSPMVIRVHHSPSTTAGYRAYRQSPMVIRVQHSPSTTAGYRAYRQSPMVIRVHHSPSTTAGYRAYRQSPMVIRVHHSPSTTAGYRAYRAPTAGRCVCANIGQAVPITVVRGGYRLSVNTRN